MKLTIEEACATLFKGQSNIVKMAVAVGVSPEEMKRTFALYASKIPMDDSVWQGDVEPAWPYIT